jgi:hypothetical protein
MSSGVVILRLRREPSTIATLTPSRSTSKASSVVEAELGPSAIYRIIGATQNLIAKGLRRLRAIDDRAIQRSLDESRL